MTNELINERLMSKGFVKSASNQDEDVFTSNLFCVSVGSKTIAISTVSRLWIIEEIKRSDVNDDALVELLDKYSNISIKEYHSFICDYVNKWIDEVIDLMHELSRSYKDHDISYQTYVNFNEVYSNKYNQLITFREILNNLKNQ